MRIVNSAVAVAVALALGACASTPTSIPQLEAARDAVNRVEMMPDAAQLAGKELEAARNSLSVANEAAKSRAPRDQVEHLAYLAQRRAQIAEAQLNAGRSQQNIERAQGERDAVLIEAREREAAASMQRANNAELLAAARGAEANRTQQELDAARQEIVQLKDAVPTDRGMVLTLGDVLFDTASATLKPGADLSLSRVADFLLSNRDTRVVIEGHTDSVGADMYNQQLSALRARAAADQLLARGIERSRIESTGLGEAYPVANNGTAAGRQQNRRVELVFSDIAGQFAKPGRQP